MRRIQSRWEHVAHQADIGVRGSGPTAEAAFEQAAVALTAVIAKPRTVRPARPVRIRCEATALDQLLADWLNALLLEMAARRMLFRRFRVRIRLPRLEATAWGETIDQRRHRPAVEVKAASYAGLAVRRTSAGRWIAECIVDV